MHLKRDFTNQTPFSLTDADRIFRLIDKAFEVFILNLNVMKKRRSKEVLRY